MKMSKKNDCLNELLKGKTAANSSYLGFTSIMLAIILICVKNRMFSVKQPFHRNCAELSAIKGEKYPHSSQKSLCDRKYLDESS